MEQRSVFYEEWLRSLREQYKHVVRKGDQVTLPTMSAVMQTIGFSEDELAQLRVEATMHVDDVGADFVPDLDVLKGHSTMQGRPSGRACPAAASVEERQVDAEGGKSPQACETAATESGRAFPTAGLDDDNISEETQPLTFEDSLNAEADSIEDETQEAEEVTDADDDADDNPQQMSLF